MAMSPKQRMARAIYDNSDSISMEHAYIKAGFSPKRANVTVSEFKDRPEWIESVERRKQKLLNIQLGKLAEKVERAELTPEIVINEIRDLLEDLRKYPDAAWAVTARLKCLELLGKNQGVFVERVEIGFGAELAAKIQESRQRTLDGPTQETKQLPEPAAEESKSVN